MLYYCPVHGRWFKYLNDGELNKRMKRANQTIIDLWNTVSPPPAPKLKSVTLDPKTTALLILDMETTICKNPRCLGSIDNIYNLLMKARKNGMLVVYSIIPGGSPMNIAKEIAPLPGNPVVSGSVDKFYKTNLEDMLQKNNIKTVIVTGYAANGAVLSTATASASRGYNVVVPVDCMSTGNILYSEQYTAWHVLNNPVVRDYATLTRTDLINFR